MIDDERQINYFKEIAQNQFLMSINEFGDDAINAVPFLNTDNITEI